MYASRLFHVVEKHLPVVHVFADDTQLYLSFRPTSSISQDQAIRAMEECIVDVRAWMCHNMMKLNDSKTEFLIIGSRQQLAKINVDSIKVGASKIVSTSSVRNLGAWFDKNMPPMRSFMYLSRLTWTIATHCFTAYRSTNSAVYSVSLMPQLASPAFFHGILTSPQRCSISTGFLLPPGSNSR